MNILIYLIYLCVPNLESVYGSHGYSHDSGIETNRQNWMKGVKDSTLLNKISIPGTHNSLSLYGGDTTETQSKSLKDQLYSGIRAFDVRCRLYRNELSIHHGIIFQRTTFGDVLKTMNQFLDRFPTEVLLMRIKEESKAAESTLTFEQAFVNYKRINGRRFYVTNSGDITLRTARGKIIILQDFSASVWYGLHYQSFNIQDNYHLSTNWKLHEKWENVKNQLNNANKSNGKNYFVNYLSGSGGSFPYFVASGHSSQGTNAPRLLTGLTTITSPNTYPDFPRVSCFIEICSIAFEGTNILATNYIQSQKLTFIGIIMADFPGDTLIKTIINLNFI